MLAGSLRASHIVGGEFELIFVQGSTYRLNLIIYFDVINGNPLAKDQPGVTVAIFRKRNHTLVRTQFLALSGESRVAYTQPACSSGELVTNRLVYTALITLAADQFGDVEGYYVSWQRCCRNYTITNIFSANPQAGGPANQVAGQTFYLEFPAVVKGGRPFINSSPRLFPPLNDFACPRRFYYVDFAGVDDDGDSLVYSLTTPLNTSSATALPPASPAPYPLVTWRPGFSQSRMVGGNPDLRISREGLLTVTPAAQGLFVFAVQVDEYRAGEKIGESRRDFQMLVVDACPVAAPPAISGKRLPDAGFPFRGRMAVSFSNQVRDEDRCIVVRVADPDASSADDQFTENVGIRAIPLNFRSTRLVSDLLPAATTAVLKNGSTAEFRVCFPACPYLQGGPYEVAIIAFDDACSLPLSDTLRVTVDVQPPENQRARFEPPKRVIAQLPEGESQSWQFRATDADNDTLVFSILTDGFSLAGAGMRIASDVRPGAVTGSLTWDAFCQIADFTNRTVFPLRLLVDDNDRCRFNPPDTLRFDLGVTLPGNASPVITSTLDAGGTRRSIETIDRRINTDLEFTVFGRDADQDRITLRMIPRDFAPAPAGIRFSRATGTGQVESRFVWNLRCEGLNPAQKDLFEFDFIVVDSTNKCRVRKADTLSVAVRVGNPLNRAPVLVVRQKGQPVPLLSGNLEAVLGQPVELELVGLDADVFPHRDRLQLELEDIRGEQPLTGFRFEPVAGSSPVNASFSWNPDCSAFVGNDFENTYELTFRLADDRCFTAETVRQTVTLTLRDVVSDDRGFLPPNVFTPNGDGFNEAFVMLLTDPATGARQNILPADNCVRRFEWVRVYNRWGQEVFYSFDRDFTWNAEGQPEGVYFFAIRYTDKEYKGSLSVRR